MNKRQKTGLKLLIAAFVFGMATGYLGALWQICAQKSLRAKGVAMTNAERIRLMNDEELAELMTDDPCPPLYRRKRCPEERNCLECWAEWLKMEAEESANVNQENEI